MGTTLGTNALLERRGARTALVITRGFGDLFEIGDQRRPDLFALDVVRPTPLPQLVVEVSSRATPDGTVLADATDDELAVLVATLRAAKVESVAVVVLHGTRAPGLERRIGDALAAAGFADVSLSHEVDGQQGLLARATTTVVDAYLTPMLRRHTTALLAELPGSRVRLMQTNGGLVDALALRGRDAVLSGPAGGVVALGAIARLAGARSWSVSTWAARRRTSRAGTAHCRAPSRRRSPVSCSALRRSTSTPSPRAAAPSAASTAAR